MRNTFRIAAAVVWVAVALLCAHAFGGALAEVDALYLLMLPGGLALIGLGIVGLARADLRKAASRGAPDRAFRASTLDRYTEMHMWGLIFAGTLGLAAGVTAGLP